MEMSEVRNDEFRTKGYTIVRNVLSPVEVEMMRRHADSIAAGRRELQCDGQGRA